MKLYNSKTRKIEDIITYTVNTTMYEVNRLTEERLNSIGLHNIQYGDTPNRRYFTYIETKELVNNVYMIGFVSTPKPLEEVKQKMLKDLKETFLKVSERPDVDTGLGFSVNGGYRDKTNFEIGKKHKLPFAKDINGVKHSITVTDYDTIITAIELKGMELYGIKWTKEKEINALTSVDECILYEATPYVVNEEIMEPMSDIGTGKFQDVTYYKNNVTDWGI